MRILMAAFLVFVILVALLAVISYLIATYGKDALAGRHSVGWVKGKGTRW